MRVFLSWSGELGKAIAKAVNEWLPGAIQDVRPWFSEEIEKGANWQSELFRELESTKFSIVILTPQALQSSWIMFEAGAAAKAVGKSHACPVLFGLGPADVKGPLASFQLTRFEKDDFFKLFKTINTALGDDRLEDAVLSTVFSKWWPDLEDAVKNILAKAPPPNRPTRDVNEMIEEVLLTVRSIQNSVQSSKERDRVRQIARNWLAHNAQHSSAAFLAAALENDDTSANVVPLMDWLRQSIRTEKQSDKNPPTKPENDQA